jgi:hypothetical protein
MLYKLFFLSLYVNFIAEKMNRSKISDAIPVSKIGPDTILTHRNIDKPKNEIEECSMTFIQLYGNGKWALIATIFDPTQSFRAMSASFQYNDF